MNITKALTAFALNLLISVPTYATAVEQKDIKFMPDTQSLMKGDVHYALEIISPSKLNETYPELFYLDSLSFSDEPNIKLVIAKSAYIVNKPAGFFDQYNVGSESFQSHLMGEQKLKKIDDNYFKVTVPGETSYSYNMKFYFDSDDISTLPNSKVIMAVTQAKKMDVISGSASSTVFRELTKFTKYNVGGVQINSYMALKENKTLVISYTFLGVKKFYALPKLLKKNFKEEAVYQKHSTDNYKVTGP